MGNYTNYTMPTNISSPASLIQWADTTVGNRLGIAILVAAFLIMFISMKGTGYSTKKIAAPTMFICTILSILMRGLGIMADKIVMVCIILTVLTTMWLFSSDE